MSRFRDYEPGTGRYGQSDPIGLAGGICTYGYVGGGPLTVIDPEGLADAIVAPYFSGAAQGAAVPWAKVRVVAGRTGAVGAAGVVGWELGARINDRYRSEIGMVIDTVVAVCADDEPGCEKATQWHLQAAGIRDAHAVKTEYGAVPNSRFDLCACDDGSIVIKSVGTCGMGAPIWEITHYRWK